MKYMMRIAAKIKGRKSSTSAQGEYPAKFRFAVDGFWIPDDLDVVVDQDARFTITEIQVGTYSWQQTHTVPEPPPPPPFQAIHHTLRKTTKK